MRAAVPRHRNENLLKVCGCPFSRWPKCPHSWFINYKPRRGRRYRFSLDVELGKHLDTKDEAKREVTRIKTAIDSGTFQRAGDLRSERDRDQARPAAIAADVVTLERFVAVFMEKAVHASGKASWGNDAAMLGRLCGYIASDGRKLGDWTLADITVDELEAFHCAIRTAGLAASTLNQYAQVLKSAFRWAAAKGYILRSPLAIAAEQGVLTIKRTKVAQRRRRLAPDEESQLLASAGSATRGAGFRLQWMLIAAIETGCRRGELLALRWADLNLEKRVLRVRAIEEGARKTGVSRDVPLSSRALSVLQMAHADAKARKAARPDCYVFGNPVGEKIEDIKRAWQTAVLRAYGHRPVWDRGHKLSATSRHALRTIDLHFHDLRHEAACRWLEGGVPLHHIQQWLGHANISQTSTYLHASAFGLLESMQKFDASRAQSVPTPGVIEQPSLGQDETLGSTKAAVH